MNVIARTTVAISLRLSVCLSVCVCLVKYRLRMRITADRTLTGISHASVATGLTVTLRSEGIERFEPQRGQLVTGGHPRTKFFVHLLYSLSVCLYE